MRLRPTGLSVTFTFNEMEMSTSVPPELLTTLVREVRSALPEEPFHLTLEIYTWSVLRLVIME
jgi:hypothetical protein